MTGIDYSDSLRNGINCRMIIHISGNDHIGTFFNRTTDHTFSGAAAHCHTMNDRCRISVHPYIRDLKVVSYFSGKLFQIHRPFQRTYSSDAFPGSGFFQHFTVRKSQTFLIQLCHPLHIKVRMHCIITQIRLDHRNQSATDKICTGHFFYR